jgi:uncharacterized integral membrane protein
MKKRVLIFSALILLIIILPFVLAANETATDKAYSCLKTQLEDNCADTLSTEQNVFSLLAMGYDSSVQSDCKLALEDKEGNDCWGKTDADSCNIKSTAQAILALNYIGEDIDAPLTWLLDKKRSTKNLNWYLEIDANEAASCKIKVNDASEKTFTMSENKKFSGTSSCLTPAVSNYYLKIDNNCLDDNFTISCDKNFISTLWYEKPGESTMYISSETHSASAAGSTTEKVNSYCFGMSSECDYQGTLWAALVLGKTGEDTHAYIPYITAMADETENKKYLPSAFLYMLTNEDDYYSDLVEQQKQGKYWEETTDQKFYDTALALLALQGVNIEQVDNTKEWLLSVQESSGCWHADNILETAFILYAGWPKDPVRVAGPGGVTHSYCTEFSFFCVSAGECLLADKTGLENYYCPGLSEVCCKTQPAQQTCADKEGIICDSNQRCSESEVTASDTNYCCKGACQVITKNDCELAGYFCKDSCLDTQEEKTVYSADCNFGETCCGDKPVKKTSWLLIILLIILIILVILAIIFRNQLKIWFFRNKSKFKFGKGPQPVSRPPMPGPPQQFFPQLRQRQIIPRQPVRRMPMRRIPTRSPGAKDTAFEETMRKLREMSK